MPICEWPTQHGLFDGLACEGRDRVQNERLAEPNPTCEVHGSLRLVAKGATTNCDPIAEPDMVQRRDGSCPVIVGWTQVRAIFDPGLAISAG